MARCMAALSTLVLTAVSLIVSSHALHLEKPQTRYMKSLKTAQFHLRLATPVSPKFLLDIDKKHHRSQLDNNSGCSCRGTQCGCCLHLDIEKIGLDDTGCVNVTYLSKEIGFEFTFSIDGNILIDKKISVRNPPPVCAGIPGIEKVASACILFQNLTFHDKQFSGCVSVEISLAGETLLKCKIGCFRIPSTVAVRHQQQLNVVPMRMLQQQQPLNVVPMRMLQPQRPIKTQKTSTLRLKNRNQ